MTLAPLPVVVAYLWLALYTTLESLIQENTEIDSRGGWIYPIESKKPYRRLESRERRLSAKAYGSYDISRMTDLPMMERKQISDLLYEKKQEEGLNGQTRYPNACSPFSDLMGSQAPQQSAAIPRESGEVMNLSPGRGGGMHSLRVTSLLGKRSFFFHMPREYRKPNPFPSQLAPSTSPLSRVKDQCAYSQLLFFRFLSLGTLPGLDFKSLTRNSVDKEKGVFRYHSQRSCLLPFSSYRF